MRFYILILLTCFIVSCGTNPPANNAGNKNTSGNTAGNTNNPTKPRVYSYEVVNTYRHDPKAFTEGLFFHNGFLYESTGLEGRSDLRKVDIETGKPVQKVDLPPETFAEGITLLNGKIYQLTYREDICRVFDLETLKLLKEISYRSSEIKEGWGLTNDGKNLIMTDSTYMIRYLDPETLKVIRSVPVFREDGKPLNNINELEYIKGEIWANIWHSEEVSILGKPNHIVRIDPNTGKILGWVNLDGISPEDVERDTENTLNGIAYDEANDRIFVTGKNWKKLFEIKLK